MDSNTANTIGLLRSIIAEAYADMTHLLHVLHLLQRQFGISPMKQLVKLPYISICRLARWMGRSNFIPFFIKSRADDTIFCSVTAPVAAIGRGGGSDGDARSAAGHRCR